MLDLSVSSDPVSLAWSWQGYSAFRDHCELEVDRADSKGFVLLAIDTTPATPTPNRSRALRQNGPTRPSTG